uniref:tRNA (guanine(46)-N(7))-methyltransferase n=1 Tax=candidate division WOR-3 bacterium TaxID=2052148 RepID=A0A7C2P0J1_UNCW3
MIFLTEPSSLSKFIGREELVFELGFGNGDFLKYLRIKYPNALIVGAEVANRFVLLTHRKLKRENIQKVFLYRGDGRSLLYFFVPDNKVQAIYINFPDPWEKPSKENKRLTSKMSLMVYYSRLKKGGKLFISTDSDILKDYLRNSLREIDVSYVETSESPYEDFLTKYARKWISLNKPISYFIIEKQDNRVFVPYIGVEEMPNFIFSIREKPVDTLEKLEGILPIEFKDGEFFYKIDKVYEYQQREFLFRVIHSEPFLNQKYYFVLQFHEGKGFMELDDKNNVIISKFLIRAFKELTSKIFNLFGKEIIFQNIGEV